MLMFISFTLDDFLSGKKHPFINAFIFIDANDELSHNLRHLLRGAIKKN